MDICDIVAESKTDRQIQRLKQAIENNEHELWNEVDLREFKQLKDELTVADNIILRGNTSVILKSLRDKVVEIAHASHQGIVKTKALLREKVWFPGLDRLVEEKIKECVACQASIAQNAECIEPLKMSSMPQAPWKEVQMDFKGPLPDGKLVCILQGIAASTVGMTAVVFCKDVIHDRWWLAEPYSVINTAYFTYDVYAMFIVYRHSKYEILHLPYWTAVCKFLNARGIFVAHHVLTILIGPPVILYFRKGLGDFFLGCYLLSETTTPFFNARVLMKKIQKDNTRLYVVINILLFFIFICFRLLIFPFMYYSYAKYKQINIFKAFSSIPWHCNLGNFGFLILQFGWFYLLMKIGMKMVRSRLKPKEAYSMQHSVYSSAINGYDTYHSD